jgi:hypothetical protein
MTAAHSDMALATTNPLIVMPRPVVPSSDVKLSGRQLHATSSTINDSSSLLDKLLDDKRSKKVIENESSKIVRDIDKKYSCI